MAEYIEREYLLYKFIEIMPEMGVDELADEIYDIALNVEAADVVPVVHGRWEDIPLNVYDDRYGMNKYNLRIRCTNCGFVTSSQLRYAFCPHCGARMDAKKEG